VQAPGDAVLKFLRVAVDQQQQTVRSGFFGWIGNGLAVYRQGTGCAAVPDGDLARAASFTSQPPTIASPDPEQPWPVGSQASTLPAIQALVEREDLAGPGARGIAVIHNGQLVAEHYGPGFDASTPLLGWSMTKSVTAALVGMHTAARLVDDQVGDRCTGRHADR
jgi:CubicO group peptidase (beta-lactamase class C family)